MVQKDLKSLMEKELEKRKQYKEERKKKFKDIKFININAQYGVRI